MRSRRRDVRLVFVALLLASTTVLAAGYLTQTGEERFTDGESVAPPREGVTVITTDSNSWLGRSSEGPRAEAELIAIGPDGRVVYNNDTHTRYWDVDPVPGTDMTVQYVAADHLDPETCGDETTCTRNVVEQVNLSTGETTRIFERVTAGKHSTRWHDADRLDDDRIVVADIAQDRVFAVNTTSGIVTWSWNAQSAYAVADTGGPYPSDWTHINDVEVLDDGRIMVSLRNHDQVVFLTRDGGRVADWTLGADGDHQRLFEQHNPDYLPPGNGGPAVLVADSENNRLVEYQRTDGSWERTWQWSDDRLQWPRDADRLPNGNTLVTDSNGDRVLEVAPDGTVAWQVDVAFPYEAERLNTPDESGGGPSARRAGLATRSGQQASQEADSGPFATPSGLLPDGPVVNGLVYVLPVWMGTLELVALVVLLTASLSWLLVESKYSDWRISVRRPLRLEREDE